MRRQGGIPIPRFCYHKLPIAAPTAACAWSTSRTAGVQAPPAGLRHPVMDGMKITRSRRALKGQRNVDGIPADQPSAGLPSLRPGRRMRTAGRVAGLWPSVSHFVRRKRVVADGDIRPLVATEMTRCIQCTRCVP